MGDVLKFERPGVLREDETGVVGLSTPERELVVGAMSLIRVESGGRLLTVLAMRPEDEKKDGLCWAFPCAAAVDELIEELEARRDEMKEWERICHG